MAFNCDISHLNLSEWQRLSQCAQAVSAVPLGATANFVVQCIGEASFHDGFAFIRADSVAAFEGSNVCRRVLLKLTFTDWCLTKHATGPLKILQSRLFRDAAWDDILLDTTGPDSVVVMQTTTQSFEKLTVAEVFAGGFQGWSQAAWCLHQLSVPISMAWGVEKAADCVPMQKLNHPDQLEVASVSELSRIKPEDPYVMIVGDVEQNWWIRTVNIKPVNMFTVSSPCQPWSFAGREAGLSSPAGRLILRTADIASALDIGLIAIEQVAGFKAHPHYETVLEFWRKLGYYVSWSATLELSEVLPCQRSRHLLVLRHSRYGPPPLLPPVVWKVPDPGNLLTSRSVLDLPPSMQQQCTPTADTLSLYLNPALIPKTRASPGLKDPKSFRVKQGHQTAGCFLAQYGFAHLLPFDLLEAKGLFGNMLEMHGCVRFFAPAEVASLHGAVRPALSPANRRLAMRLLGNAIAVPHAVATLVQSCHTAGIALQLRVEEAVQACLRARLHNGNSLFLPCGSDWLLCPYSEAARFLCLSPSPSMPALHVADVFRPVSLQSASVTCKIQVACQVSLVELLNGLGFPEAADQVPPQHDISCCPMQLRVPSQPILAATGIQPASPDSRSISLVCTHDAVFALPRTSTMMHLLLTTIAVEHAVYTDEPLHLCRLSGMSVGIGTRLPSLAFLVPECPEPETFHYSHLHVVGNKCSLRVSSQAVTATVPPSQALHAWIGVPSALIRAQGWLTDFRPNPPLDADSLTVTWTPIHARPYLSAEALATTLCHIFIAARAEAVSQSTKAGDHLQVMLYVVAEPIWQGPLPSNFQLDLLLDWWHELTGPEGNRLGCRLLSGPHPLPSGCTTASVLSRSLGRGFVKRDGHLMLQLHPGIHGGGVKDENRQWCATRLATLCLAQGADLAAVTPFVDNLIQATGVHKVSSCLKQSGDTAQWQAILDCAAVKDVPVPALTNKQAKAEARSRKQGQRGRQAQRQICAADITVEQGFFVNADSTPAVVLDSMSPGSSGVFLTDRDQAPALLQALSGVQPDELAIVILGHGCEPGTTGCQPVAFPAFTGSPPSKILVAACMHNVGGKCVTCKHSAKADIQITENCCCQFTVYQDEFEQAPWSLMMTSPVRAVNDIFHQGGQPHPFHAPWGRIFQSKGRPSSPHLADTLSFHARIDQAELDHTLRLSGHNHVYALPKTWSRQPHGDYAIVWIGSSRSEAIHAALQVPEQRGIARNKAKFGLRVPVAVFPKIFTLLNPGQDIPRRLQVSLLFKAGPLPPAIGPSDIVAWTTKCGWETRAIKALGAEHWLLGATSEPPSSCLALNGRSVLIIPVQSRSSTPSIVQSGSVPPLPPKSNTGASADEDPWLHSDPWSSYKRNSATVPQTLKPGSTSMQPPRVVTGPTEARFKDQEARIAAIEQGLADLRSTGDKRHQEILKAQAEDSKSHAATTSELRSQLSTLATDFSSQLQASIAALQGAQTQQMQQVMSSFEEVKSLLSVRDREPSKRTKLDDSA